jgi:CheY-like chemotaxis protein
MSILVVEDNKASAFVLRVNLEHHNYEVILTENGQAAVEALTSHPNIELVISDIMMPNMDGLELIAKMREHPEWRDIPVIVASAIADVDRVKDAARLGIRHFLVKPINVSQLVQLVRETLRPNPPPLMEKSAMMARLHVGEEAYDELIGTFAETVSSTIALLQQVLEAEPAAAPAELIRAMSGISETASLLGAASAGEGLEPPKDGEGKEVALARWRRLLRDLKRLRSALPAGESATAAG